MGRRREAYYLHVTKAGDKAPAFGRLLDSFEQAQERVDHAKRLGTHLALIPIYYRRPRNRGEAVKMTNDILNEVQNFNSLI